MKIRNFIKNWDKFWFESHGARQIRFFRQAAGIVLLFLFLSRTADLELFYSDRGIVPRNAIESLMPMEYRFSLLTLFQSEAAIYILHGLLLVSLLAMIFGILPRIAAGIALLAHLSFMHRNMAVIHGVDLIASFYLFYLCLAGGVAREKSRIGMLLNSVAFRLGQIQLCVIYAYSGLYKLRGIHWSQGDAIWYALGNTQLARWDFGWVSHFGVAIAVATYLTMLWEIYFPILIWVKSTRLLMITFGIILHMGIGLALNIPIFAALMITIYALFLTDRELISIVQKFDFFSKVLKSRKLLPKRIMSRLEDFGG